MVNDITLISETSLIRKISKFDHTVSVDETFLKEAHESGNFLGEVSSHEWPLGKDAFYLEFGEERLFSFRFSKATIYIKDAKLHKILIVCKRKRLVGRISIVEISVGRSPEIVIVSPNMFILDFSRENQFQMEITLKQIAVDRGSKQFISLTLNYKIEEAGNAYFTQDVLNLALPITWFLDFIRINEKDLPALKKTFKREVFRQKFTLSRNIYINKFIRINVDETKDQKYASMFKEFYLGSYVLFLILMKIRKQEIFVKLKMNSKDLGVGSSNEEIKRLFLYLKDLVEESLNEFIIK